MSPAEMSLRFRQNIRTTVGVVSARLSYLLCLTLFIDIEGKILAIS
ncbi:MAG: hypothetical protein QG657_5695 [Acidobacteriota bacterium]|nr:hypothetical protein [Acidobacteriota bacterium]